MGVSLRIHAVSCVSGKKTGLRFRVFHAWSVRCTVMFCAGRRAELVPDDHMFSFRALLDGRDFGARIGPSFARCAEAPRMYRVDAKLVIVLVTMRTWCVQRPERTSFPNMNAIMLKL